MLLPSYARDSPFPIHRGLVIVIKVITIGWLVLTLLASIVVYLGLSVSQTSEVNVELERSWRLDNAEAELAWKLYGSVVKGQWANVAVRDEIWKAHYLTTRFDIKALEQKPTVLLVHGYGTTATLAWRHMIVPLSKEYDVFALDLPGFGRSGVSARMLSEEVSRDEALADICQFIKSFQAVVNISSPFIVAHSFGGFLCTHCASRDPSLASRLLLADVPGFFSTNGGFDFMWAGFFSFGLPHSVLRPFGPLGRTAIDKLLDVLRINLDDTMVDYWHELQVSPTLVSDVIVRKFIVHRYFYAVGTGVALVPLLNLTQPVLLVSGSDDKISPPHQGRLVNEIAGVPHLVIEGAGHVPYILNNGSYFLQAVHIAAKIPPPDPSLRHLANCLEGNFSYWNHRFICQPSPHISDLAVSHMYDVIRGIARACLVTEGQEEEVGNYSRKSFSTRMQISAQVDDNELGLGLSFDRDPSISTSTSTSTSTLAYDHNPAATSSIASSREQEEIEIDDEACVDRSLHGSAISSQQYEKAYIEE